MALSGRPYSIVEDSAFQAQVEQIGSVRWDEIKEGFDLTLANEPGIGVLIPGTPLRALVTRSTPQLILFYLVDDAAKHVLLVEIHPI